MWYSGFNSNVVKLFSKILKKNGSGNLPCEFSMLQSYFPQLRKKVTMAIHLVRFSKKMDRFKLELFVLGGGRDSLRGERMRRLCHLLHVYQLLYQRQPGYHELSTSWCQIFVFWRGIKYFGMFRFVENVWFFPGKFSFVGNVSFCWRCLAMFILRMFGFVKNLFFCEDNWGSGSFNFVMSYCLSPNDGFS